MRLNAWQAETLAIAMREHERTDDRDLESSYVDVDNVTAPDGESLIVARWDDQGGIVLFGDRSDVTSEYRDLVTSVQG
jgi:hypothetical protein